MDTQHAYTAESKGEGEKAATAGLNLLASLMGALPISYPSSSAKEVGGGRDDADSKSGDAALLKGLGCGRGDRTPFKINLFPDDDSLLLDDAQDKESDEVRLRRGYIS